MFLAKIFEFFFEKAGTIKFRFYKFSNILSSEVEGQNHFQKPQDGSSEAASIYIKEKKLKTIQNLVFKPS